MFTDTDRLNFLLKFITTFEIQWEVPSVGVHCDSHKIESALQQPGIAYGCDVRDLIDMAIMEGKNGN